jgi:cobalt-zinc-cadmium efflux system outer membrane protein
MKPRIALFLIFALSARSAGRAQATPAADGLTMERAVEIVLTLHPDVLSAQAEIKAASARKRRAEARPDPWLGLATAGLPFDFKAREGRESEVEFGLEQTFEFPGKRALRVDIGRFGEDIASQELAKIRMLVSARVRKAYFRVVLSDRTLESISRGAGLLDRAIEAVQIQYAAGRAAYADVLRARVDLARLRNRALEERREYGAAAAELNLLLGRPAGEPLQLSTGLESPPLIRSPGEIKAAALAERPSLKIAALLAEQAGAAERLSGLNRRPDITAGLFVPSKRISAWGFSLGLTLPLSGKRFEGERAEAAAIREARLVAVDGHRRRLAAMVDSALESVRLAGEQVRIFELALLAEIEEELKVSLDLYKFGKIETYVLLDLHRAASEARLEHLRAVYNESVARIDLEIAGENVF